ncbi:hypothetical protein CAEBREN_21398 [Caenorhabditis brenneri]|uniref:Uncharacterized protein n=1 Tax=Caenorhabditis brenneri TaxID=135651 RepID=G0MQA4_CAEBE|nr:hypothetical protein CAEBREN_21398 [Caenorhabditis brenneri]
MIPPGDGYNLREIQDYVMRNYHISKVFNFHAKRFYGKDTREEQFEGEGLTELPSHRTQLGGVGMVAIWNDSFICGKSPPRQPQI